MDFPPITGFDDFPDTEPDQLLSRFDCQDIRAAVVTTVSQPPLQVVEAKYPRLHRTITLMWGTQEMQNIFSKWLLTDTHDRFGNRRRGFPQDVQEALLLLAIQHAETFKLEPDTTFDPPPDRW